MSFEGRHDIRELTDPRTMRALAHPIRLRLLELLATEGPLTATQAGEHIGESPASCSFHLRSLARYGFVAEAEGGRGRERPWRIANVRSRWTDSPEHPADLKVAARQLSRVITDRDLGRLDEWRATQDAYPAAWQAAAGGSNSTLFVTAAELEDVMNRLFAVIEPYLDRIEDKESRPTDALPVKVLWYAFPTAPPATEQQGDDDA
jgi:DNA-binding transcriptional ArsR family regulator